MPRPVPVSSESKGEAVEGVGEEGGDGSRIGVAGVTMRLGMMKRGGEGCLASSSAAAAAIAAAMVEEEDLRKPKRGIDLDLIAFGRTTETDMPAPTGAGAEIGKGGRGTVAMGKGETGRESWEGNSKEVVERGDSRTSKD